MELYRGRPEDVSGRLEREVRSYDLLDSLGMTYWRTDHPDMPAGNMEACNEVDAVLGVILGIVGANGVPEAIAAAILTPAICVPLGKALRLDAQ